MSPKISANNRNALATLITAAILVTPSFSQAAPASSTTAITETSKIVYSNGKPATDATFELYVVNVLTHAALHSTFKTDKSGRMTITLHASDYAKAIPYGAIKSPTGVGFWAAAVNGNPSVSTLEPFTHVRIHLVDPEGKPIAHAKICPSYFVGPTSVLAEWNSAVPGAWTQTTDSSGYATLDKLPQGIKIGISVVDGVHMQPDQKSDIALAESPVTPDATVVASLGGSVSGTMVYGTTNKPVVGMPIVISGPSAPWPPIVTVTSSNGSYEAGGLKPGEYRIEALDFDGRFRGWVAAPRMAVVRDASHQTDDNLVLQRPAIISGKVIDTTTGKPAANIPIGANSLSDGSSHRVFNAIATKNDGTFSISVVPGTIQVSPLQGVDNGTFKPVVVTVKAGETKRILISFAVPAKPLTAFGTVTGPDGKPAAGVQIFSIDQYYEPRYPAATTDAQGKFSIGFPGLKPNDCLVARLGDLATLAPYKFTGANPVKLRLQSNALCKISGKVQDATGADVPNARVSLSRWNSTKTSGVEVDSATTDAQGNYAFSPNLGNYTYSANVDAPNMTSKFTPKVEALSGQTIVFPTIVVTLDDSFVGGTVVDSNSNPVANASVNDNDVPGLSTTTDKDGSFILKGVPRGHTSVWIQTKDGGFASKELTSGSLGNYISLVKAADRK